MAEQLPGLQVYRPVIRPTDEMIDNMLDQAQAAGLETPDLLETDLQSTLMTPNQLWTAYRRATVRPDINSVAKLRRSIRNYLPPSAHRPLTVDTYPATIHTYRKEPTKHLVTLAPSNPTVRDERVSAQIIVNEHLRTPHKYWPQNPRFAQVYLGHYRDDPDAHAASQFQSFIHDNPALLGAELVLGPVQIDLIE